RRKSPVRVGCSRASPRGTKSGHCDLKSWPAPNETTCLAQSTATSEAILLPKPASLMRLYYQHFRVSSVWHGKCLYTSEESLVMSTIPTIEPISRPFVVKKDSSPLGRNDALSRNMKYLTENDHTLIMSK